MKSITNIKGFARSQDESRQSIQHRIRQGWKFGILDGELTMYNPSLVRKVKTDYEPYVSIEQPDMLKHDKEVINSFANEVCGDCTTTFQNTLSFEAASYIEKMRMKG